MQCWPATLRWSEVLKSSGSAWKIQKTVLFKSHCSSTWDCLVCADVLYSCRTSVLFSVLCCNLLFMLSFCVSLLRRRESESPQKSSRHLLVTVFWTDVNVCLNVILFCPGFPPSRSPRGPPDHKLRIIVLYQQKLSLWSNVLQKNALCTNEGAFLDIVLFITTPLRLFTMESLMNIFPVLLLTVLISVLIVIYRFLWTSRTL